MFEIYKTTLQLLKKRDDYDKLRGVIDTRLVDSDVRRALDTLDAYWKNYQGHQIVMPDTFLAELSRRNPELTPAQLGQYKSMVDIMMDQPDEVAAGGLLRSLRTLDLASRLEDLHAKYQAGDDVDLYQESRDLLDSYEQDLARTEAIDYCRDEIADILADAETGVRFPWFLDCLTGSMPDVRPGDQIIFAARPGKGKTSFCARQAVHLAGKTPDDRPVVWFNNEGKKRKIQGTIFRAGTGMDFASIKRIGADKATAKFNAAVGSRDHVRVFDIHGCDYRVLENLIKRHRPAVVIWDMLDNVGGFGAAERTDLRLERLYQWARECAVKYDFLSIPTSQVSVEGEGLAWCDMSMLKDSKCLGVNTPIRMFDGSTKLVQNVTIGDRVLGIDSDARSVVGTGTGMQQMYNVAGHGWAFQCNEDHILTTIKSTARPMNGHKKGDIIDLPLRYFLNNPSRLSHYKAVRVRANYPEAALSMDPYFLGLWLGDGSSKEVKVTAADCEIKRWLENHKDYQHTYIQPVPPGRKPLWDVYHTGGRALLRTTGVYKNKRIPQGYKMSSVNQRRALLAGLMDSDGTIDSGSCSITMSRQALIEDINEVAKSLGYRSATRKAGANAWTVQFANTEPLPVLLARKRCICKLRQDTMTITKLGMGRYYGFTVDGDARYTLGCYIATHNTAKQGACEAIITMGATSNLNQEWSRFLYVPKTKYTPLKGHRADCASEVQFNGATCQFSESPKVEDIPI